jgi:hypothetical protein
LIEAIGDPRIPGVDQPLRRRRAPLAPPAGLGDHLSRRQAAALLGYASEYPVRQLERAGRLRAVRGPLGSAWYPRSAVLALRTPAAGPAPPEGRTARPSDAQLLALLRQPHPDGRPRTVIDLVVEAGIDIARGRRIHRFWLAHDRHPLAAAARAGGGEAPGAAPPGAPAAPADPPPARAAPGPGERRGPERLAREALLAQIRDPRPAVRAAAFERLRPPAKPRV